MYMKNEENIGMFGNWNRALEVTRTKYVVLLHDDDWLTENYIETVINFLTCESIDLMFL